MAINDWAPAGVQAANTINPQFSQGFTTPRRYENQQWTGGQGGDWSNPQNIAGMEQRDFNALQDYARRQEAAYNSPYAQSQRQFGSATQGQTQATNQLADLLRDPSKVQQTAGYQFALDQGNQAINRSAAAKGMLNSGNVLAELAKYGQGMGAQQYQQQVGNLSNLANLYGNQQGQAGQFQLGANQNPITAGFNNPYARVVGSNLLYTSNV